MELFFNYLSKLPTKRAISDVKKKILMRLWEDDSKLFPKPWVSSEELLKITQQKYFDRRTRELRDQLGCDIETKYLQCFSGHGWRLKSDNISLPLNREYLTLAQKDKVFSDSNWICAICGKRAAPGVRGLQADHKIPLSRGGSNDLNNWQALCHSCNIGKRRACEQCALDCTKCSWAYPDINGIATMVNIHEKNLRKIESISIERKVSIEYLLNQAIEDI